MKGQYLKLGAEHSCPTPGTDLFKLTQFLGVLQVDLLLKEGDLISKETVFSIYSS